MKTTNTGVIISAVVINLIALMAIVKINANSLPTLAVTISYLAVGLLFVLAAMDSKGSRKNYLAR